MSRLTRRRLIVSTTPELMRRVFVEMLERANKLAAQPEFYI